MNVLNPPGGSNKRKPLRCRSSAESGEPPSPSLCSLLWSFLLGLRTCSSQPQLQVLPSVAVMLTIFNRTCPRSCEAWPLSPSGAPFLVGAPTVALGARPWLVTTRMDTVLVVGC